MRILAAIALALVTSTAHAQRFNDISVGDLAGSGGKWQSGEVSLTAPARQVQGWLGDYDHWTRLFPDIESARTLGRTPDGRRIVRFHSKVLGRPITIRVRERPGVIEYEGEGKDVTTQGKMFVRALGPNASRVTLQTTAELHGVARAFVGEKGKRQRAERKLRADLTALVHLSNSYAAAHNPRHGG